MADPIVVLDQCAHIQCNQCLVTITDQCNHIECDQCTMTTLTECTTKECTQCSNTKNIQCTTRECTECNFIDNVQCNHIECVQCSTTKKIQCNVDDCVQCDTNSYIQCSGTYQCRSAECTQCSECETNQCAAQCHRLTEEECGAAFLSQYAKFNPGAQNPLAQCYQECMVNYPKNYIIGVEYGSGEYQSVYPVPFWNNECGAECSASKTTPGGYSYEVTQCRHSECLQCAARNSQCSPISYSEVYFTECTTNCITKGVNVANCYDCTVLSAYMLSAPECSGTSSALNCNRRVTNTRGTVSPIQTIDMNQCDRTNGGTDIVVLEEEVYPSATAYVSTGRPAPPPQQSSMLLELEKDKQVIKCDQNVAGYAKLFVPLSKHVRRIDIIIKDISLDDDSEPGILLGDAGVIKRSGYMVMQSQTGGGGGVEQESFRIQMVRDTTGALFISGKMTLTSVDGLTWNFESHMVTVNSAGVVQAHSVGAGYVALSYYLTEIVCETTAKPTVRFDSGRVTVFVSKKL